MNRRRMSGHRVASSAPPAGPANEIQTITVPNFVGATGFLYFSINWPTYGGIGYGASTDASGSLEGLTASQAATIFESAFNDGLAITEPPLTDKTISVTGALDGTSLVLTVEFDGVGVAGTDVEQGEAADWGDLGMPVIATVQDGHA